MSNDYNGMKRSELPDSVFGIPQERKYPMPDEKHTRSAIKLFNHVEPKYEEQLAKAIIKNMKKYNIDGSVVGPNNRLRKYLPKDMIKESSINEGFVKSDKDIYYNKGKFDSGEINLCFITGLSGSGKSTMGRNMSSKNTEHYEMDDVICNDNFSDDNLKEYGDLILSFFKGPGKSFRLIRGDDDHNDSVFNIHKNYEKEITQAFVKYAISYCKSHKETKCVCDGIWIFMFIKPEQLKDCAVYIKGTSSIKSAYRALKRDIDEDKRNGMTSLQIFRYEFKRIKEDVLYARENQKELRSFRSYFEKQSTNESILNEKGEYDHPQPKSRIYESSGTNKEIKKKDLDDMKIIIKSLKDDDYKNFKIRKNAYYFKIEYKDGKPVGFIRMIAMRDNQYEHCRVLDISLAVDPDYRKQGIARRLASEAIRKAKQDKSIYRIYWGALRSNTGSISLAKSLGFKEEPKYGDKEYIVFYLQTGKGINVDKMNESYVYENYKDLTIVFDLGDVLVKSNMIDDLKNKYKFSNSDIKTILSHWFDDSYDLYDSNTFIETMEKVLPDKFKSRIFDIILAFKNISLYPYTEKILSDIKRLGCKIYYFSNWSRWGVELLEDANKLRFLHEYFNGGMFSYETKYKKPHKRFYDIFIQKFKLQKSNVIFFDNKQDNINMGKNFGWTGYVVDENLDQHFYDMISSYTNEASNLPQDTGISTIIFDIGDVLVSTNIKDYLKADPEIPNEIVDELLKLWFLEKDEIDDTMDLDTYREIVNKRMGTEFSKYIPNLFKANIDCVDVFDYTIPMIQDLKDKGYKVYFLSNWSAWTHDLLIQEGKFDFLSMMDGGVFSFSVGYMKPHEEIYKILLNRYKIDPEKAIFFDDKEENIEAAKKLGIKGVVLNAPDSTIVYNALKSYSVREIAMETIYCKIMNNEISKNLRKYSLNEGSCLLKNDISKKEIKDIQTIIESLDNNDFDNFKFTNIVYWDIRYRLDKPIAFITIRTKSINDLCVGSVGIAVNPKYRNQGIATSMAMKAIKWFKSEKGLDFLEWATTPSNEVFKKLAEKDNFKKYIAKNKDEYIHYTMESHINEFNLGKRINEDKAGREIVSRIRDKVLTSENYKKSSKLDLSLKCTIENIDSNIVCVLILDGDQSNRDTMEAKNLLSKIRLDISPLVSDIVSKISTGDGDEGCLYFTLDKKKIPKNKPDLLQEYGTTGGTIVGTNQPDSVYIVNYMQNNVFSGHKEKKRAICKKGMNQMYTTQDGHTVPVDIDDFKENASEITVFKLKEQPLIPYDTIIELANFDNEFYTLLTGDIALDVDSILTTDSRFVQEENFFDELDAIKACIESTILGESETDKYPYLQVLPESECGRPWNYYRDINGVFAMNAITGLRTRSYEDISDISKPELDLVKRGTVYGITE